MEAQVDQSNKNPSCSVGDVIAVRGTGWIANAIERITGSKYSHVAIYVGEGKVIEAQGGRVVGFQSLSFYEGQYDVYRTIQPLTIGQAARIDGFLHSAIGEAYSYYDIVYQLFRYLLHIKLPWRDRKPDCVVLTWRAYRAAGIRLCNDENVSPRDIVESPLLYKVN